MSALLPCAVPAQSFSDVGGGGWSLWLTVLVTPWT